MAKLNREGKLREKRVEKQARKAARKMSAARDAAEAASRSEELGTGAAALDDAGPESAAASSDVADRGI